MSTSSDTAANSPPFTLVAAGSVSNSSVQLSTLAADATQVDYTVDFTTSAVVLADGFGTVTFTAPAALSSPRW